MNRRATKRPWTRSPNAPRYEGILPAIESAHAFFGARRYAQAHPGARILIGCSGRGDKDMPILQRTLLERPRLMKEAR